MATNYTQSLGAIVSFGPLTQPPQVYQRALGSILRFGPFTGPTAYVQSLASVLSFTGSWFAERSMHAMLLASDLRFGANTFVTLMIGTFAQVFSGAVSFVGKVVRQNRLPMLSILSHAGSLGLQTIGHTFQALAGGLSFVGQISRNPGVSMNAVLTSIGSQSRSTGKSLVAATSFVGRQIFKMFRDVLAGLTPTGNFTWSEFISVFTQRFSGGMSFVGATAQQTSKRLVNSILSATGAVQRQTRHAFNGAITAVGQIVKSLGRPLTGDWQATGEINDMQIAYHRLVTAVQSFVGDVGTKVSPIKTLLQAALSFTGDLRSGFFFSIALDGILTFEGFIQRAIIRVLFAMANLLADAGTFFQARMSPTTLTPPTYTNVDDYTGIENLNNPPAE